MNVEVAVQHEVSFHLIFMLTKHLFFIFPYLDFVGVHNPYSTAVVIWLLFVFKQQACAELLRVKLLQVDQNIHPFFIGAIKTSWAIPLSIEHGITQNIDLKELISAFDKIKTWKKIF